MKTKKQGVVSGRAKKSAGGRKASHMHIERAGNGFMTSTTFDRPNSEKSPYEEPTKHVFNDHKAMANHVATTFGGGKVEDEPEKADNAKEEAAEDE